VEWKSLVDGRQFIRLKVKDVSLFRVQPAGIGFGSTFSLQNLKSSCAG
jgi:hypothetical protein